MEQLRIERLIGREILDSRGNPTVEAEVRLSDGSVGRAAAPSGASTGAFEALERRDGDKSRYNGKGVLHTVEDIEKVILPALAGVDPMDQAAVDAALCAADSTPNKHKLGANLTLAVSTAVARAAAKAAGRPLWLWLNGTESRTLPVPMMNVLNGGAHATNSLDVQEFMILPVGAPNYREGLRWCAEIYHALAALLRREGLTTAVGDEGGFAPNLPDDEAALKYLTQAISLAGYRPGPDVMLGMDAAASEWKTGVIGEYRLPKSGREYTSEELIDHWARLADKYPLLSLEDGLDEEDWAGWQKLTARLGKRLQLVGDDLFVTNTVRLEKGIQNGCGNAILIKPNQIGTLTETMQAVHMAQKAGYGVILSHRSGETEDALIADLAVALEAGQIKSGAPCRAERTAKYNRLLRIEEALAEAGNYPGRSAYPTVIFDTPADTGI